MGALLNKCISDLEAVDTPDSYAIQGAICLLNAQQAELEIAYDEFNMFYKEVLQLCGDYSSHDGSVYIGDVEASLTHLASTFGSFLKAD